jgi:phosphatidylinositol dimannoside acyltransferase
MLNNIQQLINSPSGVRLASLLGRGLPPRVGYALADLVARQIAKRTDFELVQAVQANQWVVRGENLSAQELDLVVREVFQYAARSTFDLYHYIHFPHATREMIVMDEPTRTLFNRPEFDQRGLVVVGLHLSAFDLVLQSLCVQGMKPLVLTIPDPQGGRRLEYEMRRKTGMNLLPASVGAIRQALRHLQKGGYIVTGIDRPVKEPRGYPKFFGRPAALPMHHIFLANKARVPVMLMVARWQSDGKYQIQSSELIEMDSHANRETGALQNAEKVLYIAEQFIRQAPEQWTMTIPVWPEVLKIQQRGK